MITNIAETIAAQAADDQKILDAHALLPVLDEIQIAVDRATVERHHAERGQILREQAALAADRLGAAVKRLDGESATWLSAHPQLVEEAQIEADRFRAAVAERDALDAPGGAER